MERERTEQMKQAKNFSIEVVFSALTGRMMCNSFSEIHEFIEFLAGQPVFTHSIPSVMDSLRSDLESQVEQLLEHCDEVKNISIDKWPDLQRRLRKKFGKKLYIK